MKNKRIVLFKQIILIALIILFAFSIRLGLFMASDDFHGVFNGRIIRAQLILKNALPQGEWYSPVHPPVHLLFLFLKRNSLKYLLSSALSLGVASLCRYEGFLFVSLMAILLRKNFKYCVMFIITALAGPVIWMFVNFMYSGDPLQFINTNKFTVPFQFGWIGSQGIRMGFVEKIFFWPVSLIDTLGIFMFPFGIAGILDSLYRRKNMFMAIIFISLSCIFMYRTVNESLYVQPRYGITLGLFLIPYSIYFFFNMLNILGRNINYEK